MARRITLDMVIRAVGQGEIIKIETALSRLGKTQSAHNVLVQHGRNINAAHTKTLQNQNVVVQARLAAGQKSITALAMEMNSLESNTMAWEHKIDVERRALQIKLMLGKGGGGMTYARYLANEEIALEKNSLAHIQNQKAMMMRRREILGSTMAIFGMTMSIWQMTNALSALAGENEELKEDMKTLQAVMMGATGPLLLIHGIIQLTTMSTTRLGVAMKMAVPAAFALAAIYMALTSSSKELRAVFGALAGMLTVITALQIHSLIVSKALTAQKFREAIANLWVMATKHPIIGLAFVAAAVGGAIAASATVPSGQTGVGQERSIEETGFFYGHKGETVATISPAMESGGTRGGDITVILQLDGEELGRAVARQAEKEGFMG